MDSNIITIVGNLTADPELRYTQSGLAVANFTIASTPRIFDRERNEWVDGETLFMRTSAWRELAEHVAASLTKGSRVIATGKVESRSYETREGEKRVAIELKLDEIGVSLKWGTTVYTKAASAGRARDEGGYDGGYDDQQDAGYADEPAPEQEPEPQAAPPAQSRGRQTQARQQTAAPAAQPRGRQQAASGTQQRGRQTQARKPAAAAVAQAQAGSDDLFN